MAAASRPRRCCRAPRRRDDNDMDVHPSEQELVETFLRPRVVSGDKKSFGFIHEDDVYSADPAELTRGFAPAVARSNGDKAWYFFSAVRGLKGGRKARTVDDGAGCWHSEAGAKPVFGSSGLHLGHRQSFSFITKDGGQRVRSGWLMVELGLDVDGQDDDEELVLSKVYFSPRAPGVKKPTATSSSSSCRHKRKLDTAADASPPPLIRRRCVSSSPEEPKLPKEDSSSPHPMADQPAPADAPPQGVNDADRWSMSWCLRTLFGLTCVVDEADCIEAHPWLKDILRPFPPSSPPRPPPPCPSPHRELIDMPEIREFFMRGPYRGSPPPSQYEFDPALMTAGAEQQLDHFDDPHGDDGEHARRHASVTGQLQFDLHYRIGAY